MVLWREDATGKLFSEKVFLNQLKKYKHLDDYPLKPTGFDNILNKYGIYTKIQPKFQELQLPKLKMLNK